MNNIEEVKEITEEVINEITDDEEEEEVVSEEITDTDLLLETVGNLIESYKSKATEILEDLAIDLLSHTGKDYTHVISEFGNDIEESFEAIFSEIEFAETDIDMICSCNPSHDPDLEPLYSAYNPNLFPEYRNLGGTIGNTIGVRTILARGTRNRTTKRLGKKHTFEGKIPKK